MRPTHAHGGSHESYRKMDPPKESSTPRDKHESRVDDSVENGLVAFENAILVEEAEEEEDELTKLRRPLGQLRGKILISSGRQQNLRSSITRH